jgi:hypothetical protein
MTRLDTRQRAPMEPGEELRDAARTAQDYLRRWIGVPADPDTGERAPVRQRVPA